MPEPIIITIRNGVYISPPNRFTQSKEFFSQREGLKEIDRKLDEVLDGHNIVDSVAQAQRIMVERIVESQRRERETERRNIRVQAWGRLLTNEFRIMPSEAF